MKKTKNNADNHASEKGQLVLEAILLMVLFLGVAVAVKNKFSEDNIIGSLAAGPWASVSSMMSNGSWDKSKDEGEVHPLTTVISREGDTD